MSIFRCLPFFVAIWHSSPFWQTSAQNQYCLFTQQHALCNIKQGCGGGNLEISQGVSQVDVINILHLHNQFRSKVASGNEIRGRPGPQPSASNMRIMEWDDELALIAQVHANQCKFQHDCGNCRRVSRFGVGQNLYQSSTTNNLDTTIDWLGAVTAWYDEVKDFNPSSIQPFRFSFPLGHYTAMMWYNTYKIGCGYTMYRMGNWYAKIYVCNYGPSGNIIGSQMYNTGNPCSACSQACSNTYLGLCLQ